MNSFDEMAKKQYNELIKQKKQIENELKPLKKYLEAKGLITRKKRKQSIQGNKETETDKSNQ